MLHLSRLLAVRGQNAFDLIDDGDRLLWVANTGFGTYARPLEVELELATCVLLAEDEYSIWSTEMSIAADRFSAASGGATIDQIIGELERSAEPMADLAPALGQEFARRESSRHSRKAEERGRLEVMVAA